MLEGIKLGTYYSQPSNAIDFIDSARKLGFENAPNAFEALR